MREKLKNSVMFYILLSALAFCFLGSKCEIEKHRNPNLIFLAGDTLLLSTHLTNPVVSPDGKAVYFLQADGAYGMMGYAAGAIYAVNSDGSDYKMILDGTYNALAISNDGKKLAFHPYEPPESLILVLDLNTSEIDSYRIEYPNLRDIEFSSDNEWIYYSIWKDTTGIWRIHKIYKINLKDSHNILVWSIINEKVIIGFDLDEKDNVIIDSTGGIVFLQINFSQPNYFIATKGIFGWDLIIKEISTNTLFYLPDSCKPYPSAVGMPYWFPDGNTIVFSAMPPFESGDGRPASLWILKNVFEHIK